MGEGFLKRTNFRDAREAMKQDVASESSEEDEGSLMTDTIESE